MLHKVGASGFDVTLKHLILEDGDAILGDVVSPFDKSGGGIFVDEGITLTLEDSVVRDSAAEEGGGLYSLGTTTIERSSFVNNNADDGGGVANVGVGILTVKASTISGNNAGNGGGIYSTGTLTVQASQLTQNQAFGGVIRGGVSFGEGGAVYVEGSAEIHNTDILSNSAATAGGGIYSTGTLTVQASQLAHNQAIDNTLRGGGFFGEGGAVYVEGSAEIRNTDIFSNGAGNGGGIFNADIINPAATLQLIESTLRNNTAFSDGGGLYNEYAAFISNSTLSGNHAQGLGGAIFGTAFTLDISAGTTVLNSTLSDNRADDAAESDRAAPASSGVGIYVTLSNLGLGNTIIANSVGGADCISDSFGGINDFGHNLIESSTAACGLTDGSNGNIIADPLLAPLTDNMGPTLTHALLTNSPAIGAADQTICDAAPINGLDQRGFARDAACDIGAFEANGVPTAVTVRQSRTATAPFITVLLLALCLTAVSAKTGRPKSP